MVTIRPSSIRLSTHLMSSTETKIQQDIDLNDKPSWAAGGFVTDIVNALISIKPLFGFMKSTARKLLINTAESKGVPWKNRVSTLEEMQSIADGFIPLSKYYSEVEDVNIRYPR